MENEGAEIIHLEFGRPSSDTPEHIKQACIDALNEGLVHYSDLLGLSELRDALATRYKSFNKMDITPEQILITNGATHASFAAILSAVDPGDEVIVLDPFYPQHNSKIRLAGGKIITVALDKGRDFHIDINALKNAVSSRTRMLVLINPANPTGAMYSREELMELSEFCQDHNLIVLSDEVYEFNTYDGAEHISIASLPGMNERTITVSAFTKAYAMDGWRIGFAVAPVNMIADMQKITLNDATHPCVFAQAGAIAAVTGNQDCRLKLVAEDKRRRDLAVSRLNAMPGIKCHQPQASIYAFPDIRELGISAESLAVDLLKSTGVAVESGSFYGSQGDNHLRVCFGSQPYDILEKGLDRIESFITSSVVSS
jgi:aspartate aminotransferase